MSKMDIYYEALEAYRKSTRENSDCTRQRKYIARANADDDRIEVVKKECVIDDDWIIAIENGLEFIDKAIKEERQFILSNGEIVPIEKVKGVSKESVEHLARHSNLITRTPKRGQDLVPDELYTVERETDFAVYENRFLYMLLCYLRDFISLRYNNIVDAVTTYEGKLKLNKNVIAGDRKTKISIDLDEVLKNDEYLRENNSAKEKIDRIDGLFKAVIAFLSTPLMEQVAKAPMLKPPITETNVLKMNKNFKGAVQLYYFVAAYDKKGYEIKTKNQVLSPFREHVADDIAEMIELTSFMTYEHGMGVEKDLKTRYEDKLKREKEEEEKRHLEKIKALRKRIKENGDNPEEYMLMLEKRNRALEADSAALVRAKMEIKSLTDKLTATRDELVATQTELADTKVQLEEKLAEIERLITEHEAELNRIKAEHAAQMTALETAHKSEMERLAAEHRSEVARLTAEHDEEIEMLASMHKSELEKNVTECAAKLELAATEHQYALEKLKESYERSLDKLAVSYDQKIENDRQTYNDYVNRLNDEFKTKTDEYETKVHDYKLDAASAHAEMKEALRKEAIALAKLNTLKNKSGFYDGDEDYTSEQGFDELEREFNEFKAFYKEQWRLTKKRIRDQYLNAEKDTSQEAADEPSNKE